MNAPFEIEVRLAVLTPGGLMLLEGTRPPSRPLAPGERAEDAAHALFEALLGFSARDWAVLRPLGFDDGSPGDPAHLKGVLFAAELHQAVPPREPGHSWVQIREMLEDHKAHAAALEAARRATHARFT